jgi:hypothetical protein
MLNGVFSYLGNIMNRPTILHLFLEILITNLKNQVSILSKQNQNV